VSPRGGPERSGAGRGPLWLLAGLVLGAATWGALASRAKPGETATERSGVTLGDRATGRGPAPPGPASAPPPAPSATEIAGQNPEKVPGAPPTEEAQANRRTDAVTRHTTFTVEAMALALEGVPGGDALTNQAQADLKALAFHASEVGGLTYPEAARALVELFRSMEELRHWHSEQGRRLHEELRGRARLLREGRLPGGHDAMLRLNTEAAQAVEKQHQEDLDRRLHDVFRRVFTPTQYSDWSRRRAERTARIAAEQAAAEDARTRAAAAAPPGGGR